jgi:NADPH:quinone reductase-like Zn-dependent oxidoreductase
MVREPPKVPVSEELAGTQRPRDLHFGRASGRPGLRNTSICSSASVGRAPGPAGHERAGAGILWCVMRAAILRSVGVDPEVGDFEEPSPESGQVIVTVTAAGLNPVDLARASGSMGDPVLPSVVGREGVGRLQDGTRVYFNPSVPPYGSWGERTLVEQARTFPVPDGLDDGLAVAMGIPGLAAWIPLEHHARLQSGENVLVLGATGIVGQIAVQAAKILGAGRVVASARDSDALAAVTALGADALVTLGQGDDAQALKSEAGEGYDVVIDPLYGAPFEAALGATANGARLVTIGQTAGRTAEIPFRALQGRTHIGHGNQSVADDVFRDAYAKLTEHAAAGRIRVEVRTYDLDHSPEAWKAQRAGPHAKLVITF